MLGKIKYRMKKSLDVKNGYLLVIGLLSVFILLGGFSYALFTTKTESKGTLNIITGNLYSYLESEDLDTSNSITVNSGETKVITVSMKNTNVIDAKFNLWYEAAEGVSVSYDTSKDTPPTKEGYNLIVDAIKTYQLILTNTTTESKTITFGSNVGLSNKPLSFPEGKSAIEGENILTALKKKINAKTLTYASATEEQRHEMFTFTHTAGEQQTGWTTEELTDYRYIGTTPNNYAIFNNEVWRIIGIFTVEDENGKKEQRVKLIRNESIGNYSFDNKPSGTGSSDSENGSSYWVDSKLKDVLNSGTYYNRTTGECPHGKNSATTSCDFTSNGLTDAAKSMIGKTKWYLGASSVTSLTANTIYRSERGSAVAKTGRDAYWIGEVGLMYPSDYGYAASGSNCLSTNVNSYNTSCASTDWLHNSDNHWTITPLSGYSSYVFIVISSGLVNNYGAYLNYGARPSVYLKSAVKITNGDGSQQKPYILALN